MVFILFISSCFLLVIMTSSLLAKSLEILFVWFVWILFDTHTHLRNFQNYNWGVICVLIWYYFWEFFNLVLMFYYGIVINKWEFLAIFFILHSLFFFLSHQAFWWKKETHLIDIMEQMDVVRFKKSYIYSSFHYLFSFTFSSFPSPLPILFTSSFLPQTILHS
jgi:hypothetical protein